MLFNNITLTSILGVMVIPANKDRYLEVINRPSFAISFCSDDGCIVYNKDGKETISTKNTAVILPYGQNYNLRNLEGGNFPIINFLCNEPFTKDFIEIKLTNPDIYLREFDKVRATWLANNDRAKLFSQVYNIISKLNSEITYQPPLLLKAVNLIYQNISNPNLTNTFLANNVNISEIYFRRLFKEHYGTTPKQYILELRIEEAKKMLTEGLSSVSYISERCGFSSVYHFSRAFKSLVGCTPSDYAKLNRF